MENVFTLATLEFVLMQCYIGCCLTVLILILVGAVWYTYRQAEIVGGTGKKRPDNCKCPKLPVPGIPLRVKHNRRLCNDYRKEVQQENVDCELVFFGFVDGDVVWYKTSSVGKKWIKMELLPSGRLSFGYKECYEIEFPEFDTPTVISVENCEDLVDKSLLFTINVDIESCRRSEYMCIDIFNRNRNMSKISNRRNRLRSKLPNLRLPNESLTTPVIIMPLPNNFIFKYGTSRKSFHPNQLLVIDPDYDCIIYNNKRIKITIKNCENTACHICKLSLTRD